ncbi:MAG: type IV pilus biogenesis/stability protein PilW [Betaproteobacteria bacterium]|nr:type IV pilus biogenesis/stability protein PilW [Betaproteobacteria bacterium]
MRLLTGLVPVLIVAACAGTPQGSDGLERTVDSQDDSGDQIAQQGPPRDRARIHTELAGAYYERGNLAVALEELRISIAADPSYAPAYNVLALVHAELRENDQAQANFERALRLNASDPDVNHNYGWFLCRTNREEQSLRYFLAAVRNPLYSTPQKTYTLAGECAMRKNLQAEALDFFERALRLDPNYPAAVIGLAQLRYKRGQLVESRSLVGRYNKLVELSAESLWLALRVERRLGDKSAESVYASQLRRQFSGSPEHQELLKWQYD